MEFKPQERPKQTDPIRLTERDGLIFEAIHAFDGMMGESQLERLFFPSPRMARERLRQLWEAGYLARPDRKTRLALPEMVYWLDTLGAEYVASLQGLEPSDKSFTWREKPRWSMVSHDLEVNKFRLDVMEACDQTDGMRLERWIPSGEFWSYPDKVAYTDHAGRRRSRQVRPDGFFEVRYRNYHFRLLLEIDMATEDNPRFAREKVNPGVAYLRSHVYKERFGYRSGRWLVVTTGERRLENMKRQAERAVGRDAKVWRFTTFDDVTPKTVLTAPIWYRGTDDDPSPVIDLADPRKSR